VLVITYCLKAKSATKRSHWCLKAVWLLLASGTRTLIPGQKYSTNCSTWLPTSTETHQRWSTEAPNEGTFKMWIEYGPRNGHFLGWAPRSSPGSELLRTTELEKCQLRGPCLIVCGVNPIFHHHSLISHHSLTWFVSFLYESSTFH
jgi:hypothetical protein